MALAHVASNGNIAGSSPVAMTQTPGGAGNLLVVNALVTTATAMTFGISDNHSNSWQIAIPNTSLATQGWTYQCWYCANCASGSTTITITATATGGNLICMYDEFSGANTVSPLDQIAQASGTTGTSFNSGSKSTVAANEIIYGFEYANSTPTKGATFTQGSTAGGSGNISEWKIVSSTGSYSADFTQSLSVQWVAAMVTFADVAIGGDTVTTQNQWQVLVQ